MMRKRWPINDDRKTLLMGGHGVLVLTLISCLIASGCQTDARSIDVADYRPASAPVEKKAPDSQVFVLWRWYPVVPVKTAIALQPTTAPALRLKQHAVEVVQIFATKGSPVGFRRRDGVLLGVAGATTRPLEEAHYTWKTLPASGQRNENRLRAEEGFVSGVGMVVIGAVVILLLPVLLCFGNSCDDADAQSPAPKTAAHHPPAKPVNQKATASEPS